MTKLPEAQLSEQAPITQDDPDVPKTRKAFVPLENNPEVMSSLVHKLGLSPNLSFHDVFSIDDPELLAFVPRPATALLLVFPVSKSYETFRVEEDKEKKEYEGKGASEPIIWYKQTIRNACGLIGILHAVSNGSSRGYITSNSDLEKLVKDATPLGPVERADLLYESQALEKAHQGAATQGQSNVPGAEDDIDLHFVCFVKDEKNNLWEMDGRRKGPLERGTLAADEDVLSEKALDLGVRRFLKREEEAGGGELRFSLITLAPSLD
ncbi:ubiquitin carboxyl-terminal hydrolase-like protein isozyme L3 [Mollisia scopiformis]|uniref:Ubiquitin carboxyl-terminal hydrolase n=1 Tax=Mollisia scopiformis TaxID=149040 RepID=A0A132B1Z4_MOLSC|nr:ubiquitin carboxyl-terminal hydrolase-like protein isozyme L3 [Mollisia scopiformis]KUJ06402.1 ubiquitin carboxyl-terminal hydrolase-like protein isozyme L3 [Mollisia scopiformis]